MFTDTVDGHTGCPIIIARSVHLSYYSGTGNNYGTPGTYIPYTLSINYQLVSYNLAINQSDLLVGGQYGRALGEASGEEEGRLRLDGRGLVLQRRQDILLHCSVH